MRNERTSLKFPVFAIQSFAIQCWWRRRELNSDPEVNAERLYMLSRFSFCLDEPAKDLLGAE